MARKLKQQIAKSTVSAAVGDALSSLQELRDEVREVVDNAPEGLSETQRIQTLSEAADALDASDDEPDVPAHLAELEIQYTEHHNPRGDSRALRRDNAVEALRAAVDAVQEMVDAARDSGKDLDDAQQERVDEADALVTELENVIDSVEAAEFPGMFG